MANDSLSENTMNESNPSDAALAELMTLSVVVDVWGNHHYYNHLGQLHRVHGPAYISTKNLRLWYQNGQLHRVHGPAVEWANGDVMWYLNSEEFTEREYLERVKSL